MHPSHRLTQVCFHSLKVSPSLSRRGVATVKKRIPANLETFPLFSPELVGKLSGHDYTVYAYDFSEYETPLVGQGMLSWVLASSSPTPNAPATESKTMITGRVCKNIMGLFSKGPKETLEVKLKLVPVPTCLQSEYVESMEKYRNLSMVLPPGMDVAGWNAFLKEHPELFNQQEMQMEQPITHMMDSSRGIESIHHLLRQNSFTEGNHSFSMGPYGSQPSRAGSPTPSFQSAAAFQQSIEAGGSRPGSRASIRSERAIRPRPRGDSFDAGAMSDGPNEDGPARKRARITKADWRGKSAFGTNADSLRVTASTAASVRDFRPGPAQTLNMLNSIEPPPRAPTPRPGDPTGAAPQRGRGRPPRSSLLRHDSTASQTSRYMSPYGPPGPGSEMAMDTADEELLGETPSDRDFPSSPPVPYESRVSPTPSSPALPPLLPVASDSGFVSDMVIDQEDTAGLPNRKETNHFPPLTSDLPQVAQTPTPIPAPVPRPWPPGPYPRLNEKWTTCMPGPAEFLPTRVVIEKPNYSFPRAKWAGKDPKPAPAAGGQSNGKAADAPAPNQSNMPAQPPSNLTSTNAPEDAAGNQLTQVLTPGSTSSLALPKPFQHPTIPESNRSSTVATSTAFPGSAASPPVVSDRSSEAVTPSGRKRLSTSGASKLARTSSVMSDTVQPGEFQVEDITAPPADHMGQQQQRSGSGARRKMNISNSLEDSIAAGVPPKWCRNCGEIRTSTWRKCFAAVMQGTPDNLQKGDSKEYGAVMGWEIIQPVTADAGPSYRLFKKTLFEVDKHENHFETIQLCNPCGLWFDKYGTMRTSENWDKPKKRTGEKPKRDRRKKHKLAPASELTSDIVPMSDANYDGNGPSSFQQSFHPTSNGPVSSIPLSNITSGTQQSPPMNGGPSQAPNDAASAALMRAIQSSPARAFLGTQNSPIELEPDLTPKPTRRLLFYSPPRKEGEVKSLGDAPGMRDSPSATLKANLDKANAKSQAMTEPSPANSNTPDDENDKENCPPPAADNDGLDHLFEDANNDLGLDSLLSTPSKKTRSHDALLKTPKSSGKSTRIPFTPRGEVDPITPSRSIRRTPGFIPPASMTPFTAHLNMLLSDTMMPSSPFGQFASQNDVTSDFDFGVLPTFDSPGKNSVFGTLEGFDMTLFGNDDTFLSKSFDGTATDDLGLLSSSSPPVNLFEVFEDPATSSTPLTQDDVSLSIENATTPPKSPTKCLATVKVESSEGAEKLAEAKEQPASNNVVVNATQASVHIDFTAIIDEAAAKVSPATTPGIAVATDTAAQPKSKKEDQ